MSRQLGWIVARTKSVQINQRIDICRKTSEDLPKSPPGRLNPRVRPLLQSCH